MLIFNKNPWLCFSSCFHPIVLFTFDIFILLQKHMKWFGKWQTKEWTSGFMHSVHDLFFLMYNKVEHVTLYWFLYKKKIKSCAIHLIICMQRLIVFVYWATHYGNAGVWFSAWLLMSDVLNWIFGISAVYLFRTFHRLSDGTTHRKWNIGIWLRVASG